MSDPTPTHAPLSHATADPHPSGETRDQADPTGGSGSSSSAASNPIAPLGYELMGVIGHGGMGIVFRARDRRLCRDVAVKVLQEKYSPTSLAARRFIDEARITGQLQHPGIPPVHEVGTLPDGRPFLVMKLIKGRTLADILADGSMNRGSLIAVFEQLCQAVAYAHNHGVIHRDLKPANVMVGAFGEVQVMDWGLAKLLTTEADESTKVTVGEEGLTEIRPLRDADAATQAGSMLGTPAFMSPEQAGGEIDKVDERTDVFGLGAVLCTILTGKPPYSGADSDAVRLMAIRGETAEAVARLDLCSAEPDWIALAKRCLSVERDGRPREAGEVAKVVRAHLAAAEERAHRAELDRVRAEGERAKAEAEAREQHKRRNVQLALVGTLLLLLAAVFAIAWGRERQKEQSRFKRAEFEREQAVLEEKKNVAEAKAEGERALRAELVRNAVRSDIAKAAALQKSFRFAEAEAALNDAGLQLANGDADELRPTLSGAKLELAFVREADAIRYQFSTINLGMGAKRPTYSGRYKNAFKAYGIEPAVESAKVASVFKIATSPIRDELLDALQEWAWEAGIELGEGEGDEMLARLLRVAWFVDRSDFKLRYFQFLDKGDPGEGRKLMAEADVEQLTSAFLVFLAKSLEANKIDSRPLLERARAARPNDFHLNYELGRHYIRWRGAKLESDDEKFRVLACLRAAQAIRPDHPRVAQDLTAILWLKIKDLNAALVEAERWVRLEPNNALAQRTLAQLRKQITDMALRAGIAVLKAISTSGALAGPPPEQRP